MTDLESKKYIEKLSPLTQEERSELQKGIKGLTFFLIIATTLFYFVYTVLPNDQTVMIGFAVFATLFLGALFWLIGGKVLDLNADEKSIVRGFVADQKTRFSTNSSSARRTIVVGDRQFHVSFIQMNTVKSGDLVEIYSGKYSKSVFTIINLQTSHIESSVSFDIDSTIKQKHISESIKEVLKSRDKTILTRQLWRTVRIFVFMFIFASWLVVGLSISGSWALMIFIFPIPIVFLFSLWKIIHKIILHVGDLREGSALNYQTVLRDKSTVSKGAANSYKMITDTLSYHVSKNVYDNITPVQKLEIRVVPKSKRLISVTLPNGKTFENF